LRKLLFTLGIIFLCFIVISFLNEYLQPTKELEIKIQLVEEDNQDNFYLFLLNMDNKIIEQGVYIDPNMDIIRNIFNLYTSKTNSLPLGVYSPVVLSSTLEEYTIENQTLFMKVNDDFFRKITNELKSSLIWTFSQLGIEKIVIVSDKNRLEISKENHLVLNNYIINFSKEEIVTIFYRHEQYYLPKSYSCNIDKLEFIYHKIIDYYNLNENMISFLYQTNENRIFLSLSDYQNQINEDIILTIQKTIKNNQLFDDVVIILNDKVFS